MVAAAVAGCSIYAQEALTVGQAVDLALNKNGSVEAARENAKAAESRVREAMGLRLPRVQYTESWQRSNNPVFVFGSLLNQRQFTAANFDLNYLNNPPFLNNFQSQVSVDQPVWDNGFRSSQVKAAAAGAQISAEDERRSRMNTIASVVRAYYAVLLAQESLGAAEEALKSAEADLNRAESRRKAGVTTDADVLSIRVHLAAMRERQIRRKADGEIARATLNQAMGVPLESAYQLTTTLRPAAVAQNGLDGAQKDAAEMRPEARQAILARQGAEAQRVAARSALLPEFFVRGGFEADRQQFVNKGGANWMASAGMRWNLFSGFSDRARVEEAAHSMRAAEAQKRLVDSSVKLEARRAWLDLQAAGQRIEVAQAAVAMAEENLRIIKNRYEAGLTDVTELLRTETALLDTRTRHLEAVQDQRLAAMGIELAAGRLSERSQVVVE